MCVRMVVCYLRGLLEVCLEGWSVTGRVGVRILRGDGVLACCKLETLFRHENGKLIVSVKCYGG